MTIDEAIAHAREVAEKQRKDNDNCTDKAVYGCKGCADYYLKPCIICAKEHEQLAEWLEELKSYKSDSVTRETFEKMKSKAYEKGYRQGYNKAIDDFMNIVEEKADGGYFDVGGYHDVTNDIVGILDQIAEQLKGGGVNE